MSEENQEQDKPAAEPAPAAPVAEPEKKPDGNPEEGKKFVEFENPEVEKRFKRVYANMKQYERALDQATSQNRALLDRLDKIEATEARRAVDGRVEELKALKADALEKGDYKRVTDLDEQMIELKAARPAKTPDAKPDPKPEKPDEGGFDLSQEQRNGLIEWAEETDQSGERVRPWADPKHPKYARAISIATGVMNDPEYKGADIQDVLKEVDRLMGSEKKPNGSAPRQNAPAVLSGDRNARPSKSKTPELSEDEKLIARRMFPNEKNPYERYGNAKSRYMA